MVEVDIAADADDLLTDTAAGIFVVVALADIVFDVPAVVHIEVLLREVITFELMISQFFYLMYNLHVLLSLLLKLWLRFKFYPIQFNYLLINMVRYIQKRTSFRFARFLCIKEERLFLGDILLIVIQKKLIYKFH